MTFRHFWQFAFCALLVLVMVLSLIPDPESVASAMSLSELIARIIFGSETHADKISHFIAYATLGGVFVFTGWRVFGRRIYGIVMLAAYGMAIERLQSLTGHRHADLADAIVNTGALAISFPLAMAVEDLFVRWQAGN